jgi:hypothetical protein
MESFAGLVLFTLIAAIAGVVADSATWAIVWQGSDNADGIVGTTDGGLLFAQEQPNRVSKIDASDHVSIHLASTHGAGSLTIDSDGRLIAVERTCIVGSGALGPDGEEFLTPEGVRNNAKTIYKLPMLAAGFEGRPK